MANSNIHKEKYNFLPLVASRNVHTIIAPTSNFIVFLSDRERITPRNVKTTKRLIFCRHRWPQLIFIFPGNPWTLRIAWEMGELNKPVAHADTC